MDPAPTTTTTTRARGQEGWAQQCGGRQAESVPDPPAPCAGSPGTGATRAATSAPRRGEGARCRQGRSTTTARVPSTSSPSTTSCPPFLCGWVAEVALYYGLPCAPAGGTSSRNSYGRRHHVGLSLCCLRHACDGWRSSHVLRALCLHVAPSVPLPCCPRPRPCSRLGCRAVGSVPPDARERHRVQRRELVSGAPGLSGPGLSGR